MGTEIYSGPPKLNFVAFIELKFHVTHNYWIYIYIFCGRLHRNVSKFDGNHKRQQWALFLIYTPKVSMAFRAPVSFADFTASGGTKNGHCTSNIIQISRETEI
jgi:hypothetical protein